MPLPNILEKILATKRREVAAAKQQLDWATLEKMAQQTTAPLDFVGAIRAKHFVGKPAVIAEVKKASPSAGVFRAPLGNALSEFDPARIAASYAAQGAACLSVLTDRDYFQGSSDDLRKVRATTQLPILRKDFIIDPYQILESRALGADAVLFIMGAADIGAFREWESLATSLGMAVLAESHAADELQQALTLKTPLSGIKNRDLTTFETHIDTSLTLKAQVPQDRILVTESGINNPDIVTIMQQAGIHTYLIGGALMQLPDPGEGLRHLFGNTL
ncbi:MAG: indole-3-glycerol phosphate synthase TrpC [Betaproteobacteria bacterium]|nr:indole-3-glycerol phosphate synthase TrpC [Betaproteobacteria bacterium]